MKYDLTTRFDSALSFYGKAKIEEITNNNITELKLYSYDTLVATITTIDNIKQFKHFGRFSQTTTRHQKEFYKQNDLTDKEINQLFNIGSLTKEL